MDFNINGNLYLVKETKLNFENDKYESREYKILKKWLIFRKEPKTLKQIQILETKLDLYLKQKLNGYDYKINDNHTTNTDNNNNDLIEDVNIPELYLRYLDILNNIVEI
jgi:hypothetical protein|tara:strand:+ start:248 stop:574 length:327 start_codon:yes stop_codon:yes gene_type:complete